MSSKTTARLGCYVDVFGLLGTMMCDVCVLVGCVHPATDGEGLDKETAGVQPRGGEPVSNGQ